MMVGYCMLLGISALTLFIIQLYNLNAFNTKKGLVGL
jgi:hypothetical protein